MTVSDAQKRATAKFEKNAYDKILLRIRKDGKINRDTIQKEAEKRGESVNAFILDAIEKKINRGE